MKQGCVSFSEIRFIRQKSMGWLEMWRAAGDFLCITFGLFGWRIWWRCFFSRCCESTNDELNGPINISCTVCVRVFVFFLGFSFQNIQHLCAIDSIDFMVCNNVANINKNIIMCASAKVFVPTFSSARRRVFVFLLLLPNMAWRRRCAWGTIRWSMSTFCMPGTTKRTAHIPGHQTKIERKLSGDTSRRAVKKKEEKKSNEFYFCFDSLFCSQIKIMPIL